MREIILLFFFTFTFLSIAGVFYYFTFFDKKMERRINYYFDIDKKRKASMRKAISLKEGANSLKRINGIIRGKLSGINHEKTDQFLKSAGVDLNPEEYIMLKWFLSVIAGGVLYLLFNKLFLLVPGGIIGYILPKMWADSKRKERIVKFNEGLPDMLTTAIGSLRSGYSLQQAFKTVSEECEAPVKDEIGLLLREMNYGITMEEALSNLSKRIPSEDLELMVQAILIQRQVGGNLTEVLEIIVKTIRDRTKIHRQVQTLTSQGRLSGRVIGALPVVLGFIIYLLDPQYMNALFKNVLGIIMITCGAVSGIIGFILINQLTKIEV